jgi:hypothetical protein
MRRRVAVLALIALTAAGGVLACAGGGGGGACGGIGSVSVTNTSLFTEQAVQIDGVGYGTIFPGETVIAEVFAGTHTVFIPGVSGGLGCQAVAVFVYECETLALTCAE